MKSRRWSANSWKSIWPEKLFLKMILFCMLCSTSCSQATIETSLDSIENCLNDAAQCYNEVILDPIFDEIYKARNERYLKSIQCP